MTYVRGRTLVGDGDVLVRGHAIGERGAAFDTDQPVFFGPVAFVYRWFFRAHSLKSLERNVLAFSGIGPIRESLIGTIEGRAGSREQWLAKLRALGDRGR